MIRAKIVYSYCFYLNLIFDKIQDGCQDGYHVWWRHRPPAAPPPIKYTSSCREKIKGFPLKAKSFQDIAMYQKLKGGSINPPPCTTVGLWLCVYVRGLMHPSIALKRLLFLMNERAGHWGKTLLNTIKVTITNKDLLFHISDYNNNLSRGNSINFRENTLTPVTSYISLR